MTTFICIAWCGCLLSSAFGSSPLSPTCGSGARLDHTDPSISSLMQVTADVMQMVKSGTAEHHSPKTGAKASHAATVGVVASVINAAPRPVAIMLQTLSTSLGLREGGVGHSILSVMVIMLVMGPLIVALLFSSLLMDAPKFKADKPGKEERGCLCCPWPLQESEGQHPDVEEAPDDEAEVQRRRPVFNDPPQENDGTPDPGASEIFGATRSMRSFSEGFLMTAPSYPTYDRSSPLGFLSPAIPESSEVQVIPGAQLPQDAPMALSDEPILQKTLVVPQAEGLTLHLVGPQIVQTPQQATLKVHMNYGAIDSRLIMNVFIAEQTEDKGILIHSVQHFPVAFLDTRLAVSWTVHPPRVQRHVKIFTEIPSGIEEEKSMDYICVEPVGQGHYDVYKVNGGTGGSKRGPLWYNVRYAQESANIVDSSGRLVASMEIRRKHDKNSAYVLEVSPNIDASLILAVVLSVFKLDHV